MKVSDTDLPGVLRIEPRVFGDARGFLYENWSASRYAAAGIPGPFVQDNVSKSGRGMLRGLHLQHPHGQGKLVDVLIGEVFDVAVDVRVGSPHFGTVGRGDPVGEQPVPALHSAGLRPRLLRRLGDRAVLLQVHGAISPRDRDHRGVERPGHWNPLAYPGAHAEHQGQGGPDIEGAQRQAAPATKCPDDVEPSG